MIILVDLVVRILANPLLIEEGRPNIRRQNVDIVQIQEAEEEIGIQRVTKEHPETVILEIEIKDVIILAQADLILQIIQREELDLLPERSHAVLRAVRNQIQK